MRVRVIALLTLALVVGLTACGSSAARSSAPTTVHTVQVVAGENFWGDITRQLGGRNVRVTSIISDPNADPHTYESDPKDAAAIGSARLVVLNGLGYDDFASKLLAADPHSGRAVLTIADVVGATGANPNPHLWYSPTYVTAGAQAIEKALAAADPTDASAFQAGLTSFLAAYQPYVDTLAAIKATYAGAKVAYTERVPGYLVQAAGLTLASPASFAQSVEDGNDPSPADTDAMQRALSTHEVKVLLYNSQVTDPVTDKIRALASSSRVPVVGVSETIPAGDASFQSWQLAQARAILTALGG